MNSKPQIARTLTFSSLDDIVAEARLIAADEQVRARGNWTPAGNIWHVARYIQASVEGYPFTVPWWMRLVGPLMKGRMIGRTMSAGFKAPANVSAHMEPGGSKAPEPTMAEAIETLETWVANAKQEGYIPANPVFGKMTAVQWEQLHCRHAELHFGLIERS